MRLIILAVMMFCSIFAYADNFFEKEASKIPELIQTGPQKHWCPVCGMKIESFYKTSHAVILNNGNTKQYCSIRCLVSDFPNIEGQVKKFLVVDAITEKLTDAKKAFYVIGSSAPGTMTKISKIAFASEDDAIAFKKDFGGEVTDFATAFKSAEESMQSDIAMTNMKRQKMMYPMGEKAYKSVCKPVNPADFEQISVMKAYISDNEICGKLNESQLQAVALYLWDVVRINQDNGYTFIKVPEAEKCPVCGMFVAKYPKWAAELTFKQKETEKTVYFDGVKDMMKFYFNPEKWGSFKGIKMGGMRVSDYYSQKAVDAKSAFYVAGSDILGPMGNELIPFESEANAKTFMKDHNGKKVYRFSEISAKMLIE